MEVSTETTPKIAASKFEKLKAYPLSPLPFLVAKKEINSKFCLK
jgi:hypothetical protein